MYNSLMPITVTIGGKEYKARLNFQAAMQIEIETGTSIYSIINRIQALSEVDGPGLSLKLITSILKESFKVGENTIYENELFLLIEKNYQDSIAATIAILANFVGAQKENEDSQPGEGQAVNPEILTG